jgi:hypothetical protein
MDALFQPTGAISIKGDKTLAELAEQLSVDPTQITVWKQ